MSYVLYSQGRKLLLHCDRCRENIFSILLFFKKMCVCGTCVSICLCECVCVWRVEMDALCLPESLSTLFFETGSLQDFRLDWLDQLASD